MTKEADGEEEADDEKNPDDEHGITEEDMKRIEAFCAKRRFDRSVEDL